MNGAVIASTAEPDKNKLSTDTLTYSDIQNKAEYSSSSTGVNYNAGKDKNGDNVADKDKGLTPNPGMPASGDASSTTKSAIADGTIEVRAGNTDLSKLSRNTDQALNALGQIFDKKTVQERQELAKVFGEVAYEEVHRISSKAQNAAQKELDNAKANNASPEQISALQAKVDAWSEGGANKIALHAFVGGVMADFGGSNALSGAVGAGINEAVQGELSKRFKDNPDIHQWASALVGAAVSKAIVSDAQTGASTAASGTKNNYYAFAFYKDEIKDKVKETIGDSEKAQTVYEAIESALAVEDDNPPTPGNEVAAAEKIKDVLSENGITGESANQIITYYLEKSDETLSKLDSYYSQGGKASLDLAMNAGLIIVGAGELDALYQAGKISYATYIAQREIQSASKTGVTKPDFVFDQITVTVDRLPSKGTLSNLETRQWYLQQESKIPELINKNTSLEEQARQAFDLRNQFRTQARELMADRELATSLNKTDPNLTWEQAVQKYTEKGFQGDALYQEIINSAQRSRTSVNKSLGIE